MGDYDPTAFRRNNRDVLAAWALCTLFFAALLLGSVVSGVSNLDESNALGTANCMYGTAQVEMPRHLAAPYCER